MVFDPEKVMARELNADEEHEFIKTAPIREVVDYFDVDIDLAVQLKIDEAVGDVYDKIEARQGPIAKDIYSKWAAEQGQTGMDINIRTIEPQGNLFGFASVSVGNIRIDDFKILENKDGELFVGMPSKPDKKSDTGYRNTVFVDKDFRDDFNTAIICKYHEAVGKEQNRAESINKPERMADQVAKAKKEAEKHNATLLPKDKGAKAQTERE
jgi:DNA-binding cell septation regulator SpoVG